MKSIPRADLLIVLALFSLAGVMWMHWMIGKLQEREAARKAAGAVGEDPLWWPLQVLEAFELRCSKCGTWLGLHLVRTEERKLDYGTNVGGILLADPFYRVSSVLRCKCGHALTQRFVRTEEETFGDGM